jgi:hypothetical protein
MIDDHLEFEPLKPTPGRFAASGHPRENPMTTNTTVIANGKAGGIGNTNA